MRKLCVVCFAAIALVTGCGQAQATKPSFTKGAPWVAYWGEGQQMRYYAVRDSKVSKVGKPLGVIVMQGTSNGPSRWTTNMTSKSDIHIYEITGTNKNDQVAVEMGNGPYFRATSTGTQKPQ